MQNVSQTVPNCFKLYQLAATSTFTEAAVGLGLPLCYCVVTDHRRSLFDHWTQNRLCIASMSYPIFISWRFRNMFETLTYSQNCVISEDECSLYRINDWHIGAVCVSQGTSATSAGQVAEKTLSKVGRGVTLSVERSSNTVWLFNRSEFPVFVLSPTTQVVLRLRPAQSALVHEWLNHDDDDDEDQKTDYERSPDCVVISFVKGWSGRYKRQCILSCPCWLQVVLAPSLDGSWNEDDTLLSRDLW